MKNRPLLGYDLTPYWDEIEQWEASAALPIGKLDELRAEIWPALSERTMLNLMHIVNAVYRELAIRMMELNG